MARKPNLTSKTAKGRVLSVLRRDRRKYWSLPHFQRRDRYSLTQTIHVLRKMGFPIFGRPKVGANIFEYRLGRKATDKRRKARSGRVFDVVSSIR
jgi:hypothetical protein